MRKAVFLDRDGTIIRDEHYLDDPDRLHILPGVREALSLAKDAGFLLVVISNQSGIGRGIISERDARRVHRRFVEQFKKAGITFDAVKYCPHAPNDGCTCRKPSPSLLREVATELDLDLSESYMIGDKISDVAAGRRAGCRTILFDPENTHEFKHELADIVVESWHQISALIRQNETLGA